MTSQELYRALQYVDDSYLESAADSMARRPRPRVSRRWALAAACLLLVCAVALVPTFSRLIRGAVIDAADVAAVFRNLTDGTGTSAYQEIYAPDESVLSLAPLPDDRSLPVYEYRPSEVALDLDSFTAFTDDMMKRFSSGLDIPLPNYEIQESSDGYTVSDYYGRYYLSTHQYPTHEGASFSSFRAYLGDSLIEICQSDSDTQILASLTDIRDKLFALFGVSFTDARVARRYNDYNDGGVSRLTVYFYDASAHPLNDMPGDPPCTDYISLSFYVPWDHFQDELRNVQVSYIRYRDDSESRFREVGKSERISLEEAEALLEKGYTFGGDHICSLCMMSQTPVDFSDYDYVSFEYAYNADPYGKLGMCLPFYTFYKDIGEAENGNRIYAKTYVPAVRVRGLEEYFEAQKENHPTVSLDDRVTALETLLGD